MQGKGKLGLVVAVAVLLLGGFIAADRRTLRTAESAYVDGRQVTACATSQLRPFAEEEQELDDLPATLDRLVRTARDDAAEVRDRARNLTPGLLPSTRAAVGAVEDALDAQVRLYEVMVSDPPESVDELTALGRANGAAERRLRRARNWLVAGEPGGWADRFSCRRSRSR